MLPFFPPLPSLHCVSYTTACCFFSIFVVDTLSTSLSKHGHLCLHTLRTHITFPAWERAACRGDLVVVHGLISATSNSLQCIAKWASLLFSRVWSIYLNTFHTHRFRRLVTSISNNFRFSQIMFRCRNVPSSTNSGKSGRWTELGPASA